MDDSYIYTTTTINEMKMVLGLQINILVDIISPVWGLTCYHNQQGHNCNRQREMQQTERDAILCKGKQYDQSTEAKVGWCPLPPPPNSYSTGRDNGKCTHLLQEMRAALSTYLFLMINGTPSTTTSFV